jgi:hypothetical protein
MTTRFGAPPASAIPAAVVSRPTAWALCLAFMCVLLLPSLHQTIRRPATERERFRTLLTTPPTAASLSAFEKGLVADSVLAQWVRHRYQSASTRTLRQGSHKVVVGAGGEFLFLREDVEFCATDALEGEGQPLHPSVDAISDYSRQLATAGIRMVVVPVPVAPTVYPDKLWRSYPLAAGPAWNSGYPHWLKSLAESGVATVDLAPVLWHGRLSPGPLLYLQQNTHWTPAGVEVAASEIARRIAPLLEGVEHRHFIGKRSSSRVYGDLLLLLGLPADWSRYPPVPVEIAQVLGDDGQIAQAGDEAPVLLLGDSFARIFSGDDHGDIAGVGLGHQLMLRLGVGVQGITLNGANPMNLRQELAARPAALRNKRVVVWEMSERLLRSDARTVWTKMKAPLP